MKDPTEAVQAGIVASLAGLTSLGYHVLDGVPQGQQMPYVVVGEVYTEDGSTKDVSITEVTVHIHTWSQYQGMKETEQMKNAIVQALVGQTVTATGFTVKHVFLDGTDQLLDQRELQTTETALVRHGIVRLKMLVEED